MGQKMKILNFELEVNLDRHSDVEFDGESDGDSPKTRTQSNCLTTFGFANDIKFNKFTMQRHFSILSVLLFIELLICKS
jgi:hypothetical protein